MLLQILQLLIVSYIASHGEGRKVETRRPSKYHSIIQEYHLRNEKVNTPSLVGLDKRIGKDEAISGIGRNNPEKNRIPKSKPQMKNNSGEKTTQGMNLPSMIGYGGTRSNELSEGKEDVSEKNYAQASWNHFVYKMYAAPEAVNYPVKAQEVQKEVCKTLPFTQNIIHENCETMVIQNNLCFGTCNSLFVPNQKDQVNICSRCVPFKFTMNHLKLNCTGSNNVIKVIMLVEECKCVAQSHNSHGVNDIKDSRIYGHH